MFRTALIVVAALSLTLASRSEEISPPRDPTQPFGRGGASLGERAPRFRLTAVLISNVRQIAIVNGRPYQRGETVDGAEIVRIELDAVYLREQGAELVVLLGRPASAKSTVNEGDAAQ